MPVRENGALTGNVVLRLANRDAARTFTVQIEDAAYGTEKRTVALGPAKSKTGRAEIAIELGRSHGWHDLRIRIEETPRFEKRYAGRIETGRESVTDPAMGGGRLHAERGVVRGSFGIADGNREVDNGELRRPPPAKRSFV